MENILVERNLWEIGNGTDKHTCQNINGWDKLNRKARSAIILSIESDYLHHILNLNTTNEMWKALVKKYDLKNISSILLLTKELFKLNLREGGNLNKHINYFQVLSQQASMGKPINDIVAASALLNLLPYTYKGIQIVLGNRGLTLTLVVIDSLIRFEVDSVNRDTLIRASTSIASISITVRTNYKIQ